METLNIEGDCTNTFRIKSICRVFIKVFFFKTLYLLKPETLPTFAECLVCQVNDAKLQK